MSAFTPGPWEVQSIGLEDDCDYDIVREGGEDEGTARVVMTVAGDRPNAEANAALVAAAPELYAVTREAREHILASGARLSGEADLLRRMAAALAKAEGSR